MDFKQRLKKAEQEEFLWKMRPETEVEKVPISPRSPFQDVLEIVVLTTARRLGVEVIDGCLNINELFDKALELGLRDDPMRLIGGKCFRCNKEPSTDGDFCEYCGQRIDWSTE